MGGMTDHPSRRDFLQSSGLGLASVSALLAQAGQPYRPEVGKRVRIAVVGGGFGTQFQWHEHPDCDVVAVTDLRPDRRARLQKVYGGDTAYDSLEEMVAKARDIDAVAVFSGALDHVKHTKMCMDRGWHVVSAVPACFTLEEAAALKELKERTGLRYMLAETSWYRQSAILARGLHRKGAFGRVFYTEAEYYHDRGDLKKLAADKKSRFFDPDGSHSWRWGFPPMHYPTHSLGFVPGVTGERVTRVSCLGWGTEDHPYLTDNAYGNRFWNEAAIMQTDKGGMVRCNVFWLCAAHGERAQWFGDRASLYMDKGGMHETQLRFRTKGDTPTMFDLPEQSGGDIAVPRYWESDMLPKAMRHGSGHGGSHTFISAEFINALLQDREPEIDVYEALAVTVPGIVAHQSANKDGEQLAVPQFRPPR